MPLSQLPPLCGVNSKFSMLPARSEFVISFEKRPIGIFILEQKESNRLQLLHNQKLQLHFQRQNKYPTSYCSSAPFFLFYLSRVDLIQLFFIFFISMQVWNCRHFFLLYNWLILEVVLEYKPVNSTFQVQYPSVAVVLL